MTEEEWLACANPKPMLSFLKDEAIDRKSRLFAVACCRRILHLLGDIRIEEVLDVAERVVDGHIPTMGVQHDVAQKRAFDALNDTTIGSSSRMAAMAAIHANLHIWFPSVALTVAKYVRDAKFAADRVRRRVEARHQARIIQDIFGNPFRPVVIDPPGLPPPSSLLPKAFTPTELLTECRY